MIIADPFIYNISSPSFNAFGVSCELLENLPRVNITINCTSCTSPYSVITDGSIVIPNLPAGNYTVDVIVVDSVYSNITTAEMIVHVVSNDVTTTSTITGTSTGTTTMTTNGLASEPTTYL